MRAVQDIHFEFFYGQNPKNYPDTNLDPEINIF